MNRSLRLLTTAVLGMAAVLVPGASAQVIIHKENMAELKCAGPSNTYRFVGSNAPGQLFQAEEAVNLKLVLAKGELSGTVEFGLELQEIGTRTPGKEVQGMEGFSDTAGKAPIIDVIGKPATHPFKVTFGEAAETPVEVQNVALPKRFGTYAVILTRVDKDGQVKLRQFLCMVARLPVPRPYGTVENTPVFGEGQFMGGDINLKAAIYGRMGIRGWRSELSWSESQTDEEAKAGKTDPNAVGKYNWENYDKLFAAAKQAGCRIMVTLGGHGGWMWPFRVAQTPGAVGNNPNWDGNAYWGQCDWI